MAVNDYKIAIAAAKNISSSYSKSSVLSAIAEHALKSENNAGYAVVAAELIPSSYTKDTVLSKIVTYYESGPLDGSETESKELTPLDQYKQIYTFADSINYMGMSEEDAKGFALDWIDKLYTQDDFKILALPTFLWIEA